MNTWHVKDAETSSAGHYALIKALCHPELVSGSRTGNIGKGLMT